MQAIDREHFSECAWSAQFCIARTKHRQRTDKENRSKKKKAMCLERQVFYCSHVALLWSQAVDVDRLHCIEGLFDA
jgi:hypothetical protein